MHKTRLFPVLILVVISFAFLPFILSGQSDNTNTNAYARADQLFELLLGPDDDLVNGRILMPNLIKTEGHPYLGADAFTYGTIWISKRRFNHVALKYDILDQHLLLEYAYKGQIQRPIILNNEFIEKFIIDNKLFIREEVPELGTKLFQKISAKSISCYYYFYKDSEEKAEGRQIVKEIRPVKVSRYLQFGAHGKFVRFKSNRSFRKFFDKKHKAEIKQYFESRNLHVKTISDKEMELLLLFCDKFLPDKP